MSKKGEIIIIILLVLILILLGGYIISDKNLIDNNKTSNKVNKDKKINTYKVEDYIEVSEIDSNCLTCNNKIKSIQFKNLDNNITSEFLTKHLEFINSKNCVSLNNSVGYEIYKNVLSVYTKEEKNCSDLQGEDLYSLNVDLKNNKIIKEDELLDKFNLNKDILYKKILINLADTVTVDKFLLSTNGDISSGTISITDFKNNINNYVDQLKDFSDSNLYLLYISNGNLYAKYNHEFILNKLGMGTHMGTGLPKTITTIQIN